MTARGRQWLEALPFLLPNLIGFLIFTAGPVVFSAAASLTNWSLTKPGSVSFVGLANYADILTNKSFWLYFINTGYFLLGMPISIAGSLWLAVLLNRKMAGIPVFRTILYLPSFTSGVAIMILWKALYNPNYGPIGIAIEQTFAFFGLDVQSPNWLLSTQNIFGLTPEKLGFSASQFGLGARDALIFMGIWTAIGGNTMLLYLAALTNVPEELTEAAQLDGAAKWAVFRNVTWPQLAPTTFFVVIMGVIGGLQGGFEQARVMTAGGPAGSTTTIAYYIYSKAFEEFQMGYASAIAWMLFGIVAVWTAVYWRFGNRETSYL